MSVNINDQNDQISTSSGILTQANTGGLIVAAGTNGQQPSPATNNGLIRFNTSSNWLEIVIGGVYYPIATLPPGSGSSLVSGFLPINGSLPMTGRLGIVPGNSTSPGLYINSSPSTGIFSPGTNLFSVTTNGTEALRVDNVQNTIIYGNLGVGVVPTGSFHVFSPAVGNTNTWIGTGPLGPDFSFDGGSDSLYYLNNVGAGSGATAICWRGSQIVTVYNSGAVTIAGSLSVSGTATAPTPAVSDSSNNIATTAFVKSAAVPSGTIIMWGGATPPTGFLECNGASLSTVTYATLFGIIGYNFGGGGGAFSLPDMRGAFARGWDHGRGLDPGRALGTYQADTFASHNHSVNDPSHSHNAYAQSIRAGGTGNYWEALMDGVNASSGGAGTNPSGVVGGAILAATTGISINATGSTETRPKNVALMYCIKT